ncbi:Cap15 family cyclic dinucleotide receptor domain-containing protein [Aeromonas hydrophila]|uniref:Cap15 family cyclic dinucleotide receptor domain-containing protein n=1 Tax=Aeromonas hydrophila TaxID=644 RepID=UPI0009C02558|nr:pancortin-3 [Aeromonas hydrophila]
MHDYAVFGHSRATIGRYLGTTSVILTGLISSIMLWVSQFDGLTFMATVTISTAALYFTLHWLFNNHVWKIPLFKIPDLNGVWLVRGETLSEEDGVVKYNWEAEIDIEQTWEKVSINLKTKQSSSESYTATLAKKSGTRGGWILHYSYSNSPDASQFHELNSHRGYCEVIFDKELTSGEAAYFNSNGRRTFGKMYLTRGEK